jgi:hypothetical protein
MAVKEMDTGMKKTVWLSQETDKVFKSFSKAMASGEDFVEGVFCGKCECTITTDCNCKQ